MSEAPMKARDLEEARKNRLAEMARHTVGLVWPDGRVTTHVCPPPEEGDDGNKIGDAPVRWANGEPAVWKPYREKGCRLLHHVAEADGAMDVYEQWKAVITAQITRPGMPIRGDVSKLYPPTVLKMRASNYAGGNADGMAFVIGEGIAPDPELAKDKLVGQLMSAGLPPPPAKGKGKAEEAHP